MSPLIMSESEQVNSATAVSPSAIEKQDKFRDGSSELTTASATTSLGCCSDDERDEEAYPRQLEDGENGFEDAVSEEEILKEKRRHRNKRILIGLILLAVIIFVIVDSTTTMYLRSAIDGLLRWVEANPVAGIVAFTLFVFVATVAFIPGAILTLGAGFVFERAWGLGPGILVGTLTVFIGASAGAIVSFLIGRYLLRGCVDRLARRYTIFEALDAVMKDKGFRIMALLRLSPIIPFNAINYISGVTSISLLAYSLANVAILPGTALFCLVGASAACIANSMGTGQTVTIIVIVVGVVFAVFAIFFASFYARRELNRILASREEQQDEEDETITDGDVEQGLDLYSCESSKYNSEDEFVA